MAGTDAGFIQDQLGMALAFKSISQTASMAHCRKANERLLHAITREIEGYDLGSQFVAFGKIFSEIKKHIPKKNQKYFQKVQFGYANPMLHDTSTRLEMNVKEVQEVIDMITKNTSSLLGVDIEVNQGIPKNEAELIIQNLVREDLNSIGISSDNKPTQLSFTEEAIVDDVLHIVDAAEEIGIAFDPGEYLDIGRAAELRGNLFSAERYYREVLKHYQRNEDVEGEIDARSHLASIAFSRGDLDDACQLYEEILTMTEDEGYSTGEFVAQVGIGRVFQEKGEVDEALERYRISEKLADEIEWEDDIAKAVLLLNVSSIYYNSGDINAAEVMVRKSLPIFEREGNLLRESQAWQNLGEIKSSLGFPAEALEINLQNLERKREVKDGIGEARILMAIGTNYRVMNDLGNAKNYFSQSLRLAQKIGHRKGECAALANLGDIHSGPQTSKTNYLTAEGFFKDALQIAREVQSALYIVNCLLDLGALSRRVNSLDKSMKYFSEALEISSGSNFEYQSSQCLNSMGILYRELGELEKSIDCILKSIETGKNIITTRSVALRQNNLALTYQKLEQYDNAISILKDSIKLLQECEDKRTECRHLRTLARIYTDQKDYTMSRNMLMESLDISVNIGDKQSEAVCYHELGVLEWELDNQQECEEYFLRCLKINQEEGVLLGEADVLRDMARNAQRDNLSDNAEILLRKCNAIRVQIGLKPLDS